MRFHGEVNDLALPRAAGADFISYNRYGMTDYEAGPEATIYEIVIPPGPDRVAHVQALGDLAAARGLEMRRQIVPPQDGKAPVFVMSADLRAASEELWGSSVYGDFADSVLVSMAGAVRGYVGQKRDSAQLHIVLPRFGLTTRDAPIGAIDLDPAVIDRRVQARVGDLSAPFQFIVTPPADAAWHGPSKHVRDIVPLPPTREKLRQYLLHTGLSKQRLHGAVGKALATLSEVAGLSQPLQPAERDWKGSVVSAADLRAILEANGRTRTQQQTLLDKIAGCVRQHLREGVPDKYGEVVIEGTCSQELRYHAVSRNVASESVLWESIAVGSLVQMARRYASRSNMVPLLREFAGHHAAWMATQQRA